MEVSGDKSMYNKTETVDLKEEFIMSNNRKTKIQKVNKEIKKKKRGCCSNFFRRLCSCFLKIDTSGEVPFYLMQALRLLKRS